jgi:hypothetical protein
MDWGLWAIFIVAVVAFWIAGSSWLRGKKASPATKPDARPE